MTNLTPERSFDNVIQLETTTPVQGGPGGVANSQAQALLNRTEYLSRYTAQPYQNGKEYEMNERVLLDDGTELKSIIAGNTANPNVDKTGWVETSVLPLIKMSVAAMVAETELRNGQYFQVMSRDTPNYSLNRPFSGGGVFVYDQDSILSADDGIVFDSPLGGKFIRVWQGDVHISWFAGHGWTDEDKTERVQKAIDKANRVDRASALKCDGKFTITQCFIDRLTDTTVGDFVIYATGNNDGFKITSPSTMFSSRLPYNPSDAPAYTQAPCSEFTVFRNIDFEAVNAHEDNCVFDDKFLRLTFDGCTHRKMRGCKSGQFLQTIKWINKNKFRQHTGYFVECVDAYDVRSEGSEFENSGRGFRLNGNARGCHFGKGLYQGSLGPFLSVAGLFGGTVSEVYFEANGGQDIVFGINSGVSGGTMVGNIHILHTEQLEDPNYYPVDLGRGRGVTAIGCSSNGNFANSDLSSALEVAAIGCTAGVGRKILSYDAKEVITFTPPLGTDPAVPADQGNARLLRNHYNIVAGTTGISMVRLPPLINAGSEPFITINNKSGFGLRIYPSTGERIEGVAYNEFYLHGLGEIRLARSTSDYWTII